MHSIEKKSEIEMKLKKVTLTCFPHIYNFLFVFSTFLKLISLNYLYTVHNIFLYSWNYKEKANFLMGVSRVWSRTLTVVFELFRRWPTSRSWKQPLAGARCWLVMFARCLVHARRDYNNWKLLYYPYMGRRHVCSKYIIVSLFIVKSENLCL